MSERDFGTGLQAALAADTASLAFLVYVDWPSDPGYFWTGVGTLPWNGEDWAGTGNLGRIDKVADSTKKENIGVLLTLNYLDDDVRNEVVTNDPVGRDGSLYMALLDADNQVSEAYEIFPGFIDEVEIIDSGSTGSISVRMGSELARMVKQRAYQLTNAHQQYLFPGDLGLEYAGQMDEPVHWGIRGLDIRGRDNIRDRDRGIDGRFLP